jgi:hypothetical protein
MYYDKLTMPLCSTIIAFCRGQYAFFITFKQSTFAPKTRTNILYLHGSYCAPYSANPSGYKCYCIGGYAGPNCQGEIHLFLKITTIVVLHFVEVNMRFS